MNASSPMVLTPRSTRLTRAMARVLAGFFFLFALAIPYAGQADEGGEVFKDITFDVGLAELGQRTVTSGWMDIDLDGHLEPYWMGEAKLHYIKTTPDGYVMAEAVLSGMEDIPMEGANAQPAATLPIDVDRDGKLELMVFAARPYVFKHTGPDAFVMLDTDAEKFPLSYMPSDAATGDFNADGWPDVVIGMIATNGEYVYPSGAPDFILMNRGGTFEMTTLEPVRWALSHGVTIADMDGDGRADIVESLDFSAVIGESRILLNRTNPGDPWPSFEEADPPYDIGSFGMGAAVEDIDADGRIDIYNSSAGRDFLLFGQEDGSYLDRTYELGIWHEWASQDVRVQWSPALADFNGDSRIDIFVRHGHVADFDFFGTAASVPQPDILYAQQEDGTFKRLAVPFEPEAFARGHDATLGDLDRDGLPDVAMGSSVRDFFLSANTDTSVGRPFIWHNVAPVPETTRRLTVHLAPTISANPAAGALVAGTCGGQTLTRRLTTGGRTGGAPAPELFFAWPNCSDAPSLVVTWPSGARSNHEVTGGETYVVVQEPEWMSVSREGENWTISLDPTLVGQSICIDQAPSQSAFCCDVASAPCDIPYTSKPSHAWTARVDDGPPQVVPSRFGMYRVLTDPVLPTPGKPVTIIIQHGGLAESFDPDGVWLRQGATKIPWETVDNEKRRMTVTLDTDANGDAIDVSLIVGTSVITNASIETGFILNPNYVATDLFPYQTKEPKDAWWFMLPVSPDVETLPVGMLSVETLAGKKIDGQWKSVVGSIVFEAMWEDVPVGSQINIYDGGSLRAGPLPAYHQDTDEALIARVQSARGFISRPTIIQGGDVGRIYFTLLDGNGYPVPPKLEWITMEFEGLEMNGEPAFAERANLSGGSAGQGWDITVGFKSLANAGKGRIYLRLPDDRIVAYWNVEVRPPVAAAYAPEHSTTDISHDTLPAGVGATAEVQVFPRNIYDELVGMDAKVEVKAPPIVSLGPVTMSERGHFTVAVFAHFFGGQAPIEVWVNDTLLATHPLEIVGPTPPSVTDDPTVSMPGSDTSGTDVTPAPEPDPGDGGCQTTTRSESIFMLMFWLALMGLGWHRRRLHRSISRKESPI